MNPQVLTEQLQLLHTVSTTKEIELHLGSLLPKLGLEFWVFGLIEANSLTLPRGHMVSNFPLVWGLEYRLRGYAKIDYVLQGMTRRNLPLIWNPADPEGKTECDLKFDAILRARKWGGGVAFYARAEGLSRLAFNTAFRRSFAEIEPVIQRLLPLGQFIAIHVMEAMIRVTSSSSTRTNIMTPREEEVARLYVDGKTPWEIGVILDISERTARAHLDRVAEKLGLNTKREIITKAPSSGILTPSINVNEPLIDWESSRKP